MPNKKKLIRDILKGQEVFLSAKHVSLTPVKTNNSVEEMWVHKKRKEVQK